jgi:acetyl-CoA synthase
MPKELKERIKESFQKRAEEEGIPELIEKIADETVCEDIECLLDYLSRIEHPALEMEPIIK